MVIEARESFEQNRIKSNKLFDRSAGRSLRDLPAGRQAKFVAQIRFDSNLRETLVIVRAFERQRTRDDDDERARTHFFVAAPP